MEGLKINKPEEPENPFKKNPGLEEALISIINLTGHPENVMQQASQETILAALPIVEEYSRLKEEHQQLRGQNNETKRQENIRRQTELRKEFSELLDRAE